ncbi:hypothetical protein K9N68_01430 [Kovacikia minuta CCNUW1]|nr:hypothetical protein [Kovacikia minuta]UBF26695.1 hypothetical protein K9N68_01430 [Kovacikia minuta CCNUW1]
MPYTPEAARWFEIERARLIKVGLSPAYADGQIAKKCLMVIHSTYR